MAREAWQVWLYASGRGLVGDYPARQQLELLTATAVNGHVAVDPSGQVGGIVARPEVGRPGACASEGEPWSTDLSGPCAENTVEVASRPTLTTVAWPPAPRSHPRPAPA